MGMDAIISLPGLATTAITGTLTLTKSGSTARVATFLDLSGTVAYYEYAGTWMAAQTIDRGTGALPTPIQITSLVLGAADSQASRILGYGFSAGGIAVRGYAAGGTRASPSATPADTISTSLTAGGYDGSAWNDSGAFTSQADGNWSVSNRGNYWKWTGIPGGSITGAEWMRLQGGNLVQSSGAVWSSGGLSGETGGKHLISGYDTTNNIGYIRSANNGTAFTELRLAGSVVTIYTGLASSVLGATLDSSGNLGLGAPTTAGNGLLQLASGTTKANGVAAGPDTFFFRDGAGSWKIGGQNANAYLQVDGANSGTNGGSFVVTRLNGTASCGIGNWSALIGGAHDATPTVFGGGNIRIAPNGVIAQTVKGTGQTRFLPLASDPAGAETGDVYYNSTTNKLRVYNGAWVDLH